MILVDSNIFIRLAVERDPLHLPAQRSLQQVLRGTDELAVAPK